MHYLGKGRAVTRVYINVCIPRRGAVDGFNSVAVSARIREGDETRTGEKSAGYGEDANRRKKKREPRVALVVYGEKNFLNSWKLSQSALSV